MLPADSDPPRGTTIRLSTRTTRLLSVRLAYTVVDGEDGEYFGRVHANHCPVFVYWHDRRAGEECRGYQLRSPLISSRHVV